MSGLTVLAGVVSVLGLLYALLRRQMSHWQRLHVPGPVPNLFFGSFAKVVRGRARFQEEFQRYYKEYRDLPYVGLYFFQKPVLLLNDPETIQRVLVTEFHDYNGRGIHNNPAFDVLANNLFFIDGTPWRRLRTKLSPAFTPSKIKYMFGAVRECAENLREHLEARAVAAGGSHTDEVRELSALFATDIISSVAFGIESNSLKHPDSEMRDCGRRFFAVNLSNFVRDFLTLFGGRATHWIPFSFRPASINNFFTSVAKRTIEFREKNNVNRADVLNLLLELKNKGFIASEDDNESRQGGDNYRMTDEQITAQVAVFFAAGFETNSTTTSFALYEMVKHPHVLGTVTEEVNRVLEAHDGNITFDSISEMRYLEQVVCETLRLYTPLFILQRECMRTRKLPLTDLTLPKGTLLLMSLDAIHRDPKYWTNPDVFDPERFSEENKKSIPPMAFLPFGEGPRTCIGMRLAMVSAKTALATLLANFNMSLSPKTPAVLKLNTFSITPNPVGGLWLTFEPRKK